MWHGNIVSWCTIALCIVCVLLFYVVSKCSCVSLMFYFVLKLMVLLPFDWGFLNLFSGWCFKISFFQFFFENFKCLLTCK